MIYRKKSVNLSKSIIPNAFTALNAFCGFLAIIYTSQNNFEYACACIILASLFDLVDGIIARLLKTSSQFGVELDSLSDIISFGVAPSFLIYQVYLHQFGVFGIIISSFPMLFGAFRLARFNVMLDDIEIKSDFKGLPIPVSGISLSAFIWAFNDGTTIIEPYADIVIPFILLLSVIMVSNIRYDSFTKIAKNSVKSRLFVLAFLVTAIVLAFLTSGSAIFFIFLAFVLFGIFRYLLKVISNRQEKNQIPVSKKLD